MRERCYQCFRPKSSCFCEAIPRIDNRTDILILQHIGERFHPFNTARIVHKALRRSRLIADHNQSLGARQLPICQNAGLLYPRADAPSLNELARGQRPDQLVIVDGTWHQAKTIVRDVQQLRHLPCYRLQPDSPGQYRIRREPDAQSLSTLEATVAALRTLEPETAGLEQMLSVFHAMVEKQVAYPATHGAWRRKRSRQTRPRHVPQALLQDPHRTVVAYGEATPNRTGRMAAPTPVNWVARRLGTDECFSCQLQQPHTLSESVLEHMRLSAADFEDAVSSVEFCRLWKNFLHRHDTLIVYHNRTYQLLGNIQAAQPRCLVLKSIFGNWRSGLHSLEALMAIEGLPLPARAGRSRAWQRLDMAVAMVAHLRNHYGRQT